jgi:mannosyltransferase
VAPPPPATLLRALAAAAVAVATALRFVTTSDLWLDEALTVNVARLPLGDLPEALRHDGAPPLSYAVLHGWMRLFGTGDLAVRSLSAVLGVAALPAMWALARRRLGTIEAGAAVLLLAASPYAIRYATEARMYALVILLTVLGGLAVDRAVESPTPGRLAAVAVVSGLLLLAHYWALYLVAVTAAVLGAGRRWAAAGAAVAGGLLFLPWLPVFLHQLRHTGTPWAEPAGVEAVTTTLSDFAGGATPEGRALLLVLGALAALGLLGRAVDRWRVELDLRTRPRVRAEAVVVATTLLVALAAGLAAGSGYASRYAAVVLAPFLLVAAAGAAVLADARVRAAVLALAVALGLAGGVRNATTNRTQAGQVATAIAAAGRPGDVVAYCPDQLGPAVDRLLPEGFVGMTFPRAAPPERVDWVDYEDKHDEADPAAFARTVLDRAGPRATVFLVWAPGYRTLGTHCEALRQRLIEARPGAVAVLEPDHGFFEHHALVRYPAP